MTKWIRGKRLKSERNERNIAADIRNTTKDKNLVLIKVNTHDESFCDHKEDSTSNPDTIFPQRELQVSAED